MIHIPRLPRPDLPELNFEGVPWRERPLVPAPDREDVCMDAYYPRTATSGTQIIYMEEEIVGDVAIATLNYNGTATPRILQPLISGSYAMLGPVVRNIDGFWQLIITQRQDYETEVMRGYMLEVEVPGETLVVTVTLQIVNIDDNAPIIHIFDSCVVPELNDPGLTDCIYEVSDEDGQISTSAMTFEISSDRNDGELFYMVGGNISPDWKRMTMTVGVNATLNFERNALHIFRVTALDSLPNTHTVTLMVQVENVEHRPPRWIEIFAVQQFDEKTAKNFSILAIDGDTGIMRPIYYRIDTLPEDAEYFDIETIDDGDKGGILIVKPINRDLLQRELFPISITAYKSNNESLYTTTNVVIIINDVNDNKPEPLHEEYTVDIMEETALTLNFDKEFGFHDIDLGENAQYTVRLESDYPPGAASAFFIAPEIGYQRQTFIMGTQNHSMLDFEVPEFQNIRLKVIATDMNRTDFVGVAIVNINLINWNDESPIFERSSLEVSFDETEGEGYFVGNLKANDRDINDTVVHSLLGNAQNYLRIDRDTGDIFVSIDEAFDYHRQNEIFVQVHAIDTLGEPYNTDTSQLIIKLNDINNTPPSLSLPRRSPEVEENVPEGYVITEDIVATDPDTTADLKFEILWDTSYATKQGRETDPREYHHCVEIETLYPYNHTRSAVGRVVVKEIRHNVTIDYEMFEMLYLTVRVVDRNTEIGDDYDELTFTLIIIDLNDNPPIWADNTLTQAFTVRENSRSNVVIGSVLATDIDGPLYNQVRYFIRARDDTPEDLVKIDLMTGQITVDKDSAIDADTPPRYNLLYTVVATDRCLTEECPPDHMYHETEGYITIAIQDTNNKVPYPNTMEFPEVVYIYENATSGDEVVTLVSNDYDRDEMYHTVRYQINYAVNPRLRSFFSVELDSGLVLVDYTGDEVLDRDGDESTHRIFFNLIDNFYSEGDGNRNQNTTEVLVVLLDVNDNAPELPDPSELSWTISEGLLKGERLSPFIHAPDRDEPNTNNSLVGYEILNLTTSRDVQHPMLFNIITIRNDDLEDNVGELETAVDLKGYWGTYEIGIRAYDHGIPQQCSEEIYSITVEPYNFHDPVFVFPLDGAVLRLATERAEENGVLVMVNGEFLDRVKATDEDGLEAGIVTFEVIGDDDAAQHLHILNDRENQGILMLKKSFTEKIREFQVTIRGTDGGRTPGPRHTDTSLRVVFVPTQGDPVFPVDTTTVAFVEREGGLSETQQLVLAEDPKNHLCVDDCHDIFYRILDGNDEGHFELDSTLNSLRVVRELNRAVSQQHTLRVAAANSAAANVALQSSILTVIVNVREANPQPYFDRKLYTGGISTLDSINRVILTVSAQHSENAAITYSIDWNSMEADPSLSAVQLSAFQLHPSTGALSLNMQPTASMHGAFRFSVRAVDPAGAYDTAEVRIYLISSQNRVFFIFVNTLEQVEAKVDFIANTFSVGFQMTCHIDQVLPAADEHNVARSDVSEVWAHFLRDDEPVHTDVIETLRSDTQLLTSIQRTLSTELLVLQDLVTGDSPTLSADSSALLVLVLGALAAALALLCLLLLAGFVYRTRTLNRQLRALSMTKYGSAESALNRAGLAAPGTNKHAAAGSNPVWNEALRAPDFDALSEDSDDSDLIGIEDLPQFSADFFPPEAANSQQFGKHQPGDDIIATHKNNFGLNTPPFSNQFPDSSFRR
ncbi:protocadherin Fat 1-like [Zerene cesonia]|uniref:protocadherin Fat 1-like n=1 Tax=Zerene cesonia TaxID=33412 RepID=UPI0018E51E10|nr:protocadherin Fat 1-like [Zerene cesonia]